MDQKDASELTAELNADPSFVEATIGLDNGRLLKSATHVYFIAPRMGGWEIVEQSVLSDVSRVEKKSNFMGDTFIMHTKSGRWMCKEVPEDIDLRSWILQKAKAPHGASVRTSSNISSQTSAESVVNESNSQPEWESSTGSVSRPETDSANFFSSQEETADQSLDGFDDSDMSTFDQDAFDQVPLSEELESVFDSISERPAQSLQKPRERIKEVDDLLEKIASGEDDGNESGCGGAFVKLFIFIWIFGIFADFCN